MVKVNPQHVMVLHRLTNQPILACHDTLVEFRGDLAAVIHQIRWSPEWGLLNFSDAELTAVMAECGVVYAPAVRVPVILTDEEVVARMTESGEAVANYFLMDGTICVANEQGNDRMVLIDDEDLAVSIVAYLRRMGATEYPSYGAYHDHKHGTPSAPIDCDHTDD